MAADLVEKTDRYEELLADALEKAERVPPGESPLGDAAAECIRMATAYLEDGRHFRDDDDGVNALAAFAYGHGWLDAAVRCGLVAAPSGGEFAG